MAGGGPHAASEAEMSAIGHLLTIDPFLKPVGHVWNPALCPLLPHQGSERPVGRRWSAVRAYQTEVRPYPRGGCGVVINRIVLEPACCLVCDSASGLFGTERRVSRSFGLRHKRLTTAEKAR